MDNFLKGKRGETFVNELAENTFLNYWCFPNPHDEEGNKKEICDLLILFKNICIICQIKNYEFKENHERYFRKTVESGADQIQGAERKLFHLNRDIWIKNEKQGLIKFDKEKYNEIIRIVIHIGEGFQFQNLGRLTKSNHEFIHIIGKEDIQYLLNELNTISDFVQYLIARESLVAKIENLVFAGREKDLLGLYQRIKPSFEDFIESNKDKVLLIDGENSWDDYVKEKESYENEDILLEIEGFIYDWVNRDLIINEKSREIAEELMSLNREERRFFTASLLTFIHSYTDKGFNRIIRRNLSINNIGFVFFYYPSGISWEQLERLKLIAADGYALHLDYSIVNFIVIGITEKENINILHVDLTELKDKNTDELRKILKHLGWFEKENMQYMEFDFNKRTKNCR
ncbi:MAG: hypothetical protein A2W91_19685 [Bacteroidetes bacterium GWF2_38_335]|nr:MAG: hypothetical protein A2W91_19685 [Bacteroidetes bacterium GWF2_38_335]OFY79978.1 MAG: hypothetical protein A2281_11085 [Bacteroidetes bacterium RIFOXYA12_FULL_38_20]HBS86438.1 hypothetical protein [Bacteroidales bacterium]